MNGSKCDNLFDVLKENKYNKMIVILVMTLLIGSIFVTFGCLEDEGGNSPEDALIEFFKSVDTQEGKEAMSLFASKFVDNETIEEKREQMREDISNGNMTIERYSIKEVRLKEDMNQTEKEGMDKFADFCENYTDKDVQSYCRVNVNLTESFSNGQNFTGEVELPLIKIDDGWYLTNLLYASYLYRNLPVDGPSQG